MCGDAGVFLSIVSWCLILQEMGGMSSGLIYSACGARVGTVVVRGTQVQKHEQRSSWVILYFFMRLDGYLVALSGIAVEIELLLSIACIVGLYLQSTAVFHVLLVPFPYVYDVASHRDALTLACCSIEAPLSAHHWLRAKWNRPVHVKYS